MLSVCQAHIARVVTATIFCSKTWMSEHTPTGSYWSIVFLLKVQGILNYISLYCKKKGRQDFRTCSIRSSDLLPYWQNCHLKMSCWKYPRQPVRKRQNNFKLRLKHNDLTVRTKIWRRLFIFTLNSSSQKSFTDSCAHCPEWNPGPCDISEVILYWILEID